MAELTRYSDQELQRAFEREELCARRQARYRANLAFVVRQLFVVLALIAVGGSMFAGWPVPHTVVAELLKNVRI